ncbi:MAG TPA: rod shape-determining protein RodA [Candidatus Merdenecus merdavium]|nr:rod shape-determining protein RodA [Candidatus Merdenecus merdavium]
MLKQYKLRDYKFRLIIWLLAISFIGVLVIGSAQHDIQDKQILGVILGVVIMLILSFIDYGFILNLHWLMYIANLALLLYVEYRGRAGGGAERWVKIAGIVFQPSELSKILLILFFAKFIMDHEETLNTLKTLLQAIVLLAIPVALIMRQPDLSSSLVILVTFCILIYIGGLKYKIIGGIIVIAIPLIAVFFALILQPDQKILKGYQAERILLWLKPEVENDKKEQQDNSKIAIASGQLYGKGLNNEDVSSVKNSKRLSQAQTDFIFAVVGEELGFIGSCTVIFLLLLITLECIFIGQKAKDLAGTLICCGMGSLIGIQGFFNMGVATGLLPNTGLPLPFVSYGLTSLVSLYIGMGIVLNIGLQSRKY